MQLQTDLLGGRFDLAAERSGSLRRGGEVHGGVALPRDFFVVHGEGAREELNLVAADFQRDGAGAVEQVEKKALAARHGVGRGFVFVEDEGEGE